MEPPRDYTEAAKFDNTGRPFHFLFYTAFPHTYELQYVSKISVTFCIILFCLNSDGFTICFTLPGNSKANQ